MNWLVAIIKALLPKQEADALGLAEKFVELNLKFLKEQGIVVTGLDMRRIDDIQRGLTMLKIPTTVDGRFGAETVASLRAFQMSIFASVNGQPDYPTIKLLAEHLRANGQEVFCP